MAPNSNEKRSILPLLETGLVGLPNAEKSHTFPEPFYQVLQARVGEPTTHPPPHPPFPPKLDQVQQILERPSEGGRLRPSADTELS